MITIFTDSPAAIAIIFDSEAWSGGDAIQAFIDENAHEIKNSGYTLVFWWIPSHLKVS